MNTKDILNALKEDFDFLEYKSESLNYSCLGIETSNPALTMITIIDTVIRKLNVTEFSEVIEIINLFRVPETNYDITYPIVFFGNIHYSLTV